MLNKDFFVEITKDLYRLTLFFPKKEPLRYKMRQVADKILADLLELSFQAPEKRLTEVDFLSEFEVLDGFFELAKAQNWISPVEILKLQENYSKLKGELETGFEKEKTLNLPFQKNSQAKDEFTPLESGHYPVENQKLSTEPKIPSSLTGFIVVPAEKNSSMSERQEKILAFLREQGRAQVWQLKQILPEVTKRTLRRDFDNLLKKGLVERTGERNNTFYQIKIAQV